MDPAANPYLAHMHEDASANGNGNGYHQSQGGLRHLQRHATTSEQASNAEDGPSNPFTGGHLSQRYFGILKTRRNLPVHAQRYAA